MEKHVLEVRVHVDEPIAPVGAPGFDASCLFHFLFVGIAGAVKYKRCDGWWLRDLCNGAAPMAPAVAFTPAPLDTGSPLARQRIVPARAGFPHPARSGHPAG